MADVTALAGGAVAMMARFQNCRLARMSDGHYCVVRDLGPVKGGKGLKHHEVVIDFSARALFKYVRTNTRAGLSALMARLRPATPSAQLPEEPVGSVDHALVAEETVQPLRAAGRR